MSSPQNAALPVFIIKFGQLPVVLVLWLAAPWAVADSSSEAHRWLLKMSDALQSLSYEGVFVHRSEDQLTAMKVTHIAGNGVEEERLVTLTGELREIVHRSGYLDRGVQSGVGDGGHAGVAGALNDIANYYTLTLGDTDRVADRSAQIIVIDPKDEFRYGYRLWLDEVSGLLLKSDLLALSDRVIEQVMFTSLSLLDDGGAAVDDDPAREPVMGIVADALPRPPRGWTVGDVPSGFSLMMAQPVSDDHKAQHMIYTDGLASVSVFVEASNEEANTFEGISRMGAVSAYGKMMEGYQVTVVGEVPEATVKRIGASIHYTASE